MFWRPTITPRFQNGEGNSVHGRTSGDYPQSGEFFPDVALPTTACATLVTNRVGPVQSPRLVLPSTKRSSNMGRKRWQPSFHCDKIRPN
jgi:hypothetical protein